MDLELGAGCDSDVKHVSQWGEDKKLSPLQGLLAGLLHCTATQVADLLIFLLLHNTGRVDVGSKDSGTAHMQPSCFLSYASKLSQPPINHQLKLDVWTKAIGPFEQ